MYEPNEKLDRLVSLATMAAIVLSAIFLLLFLFGYGHITFTSVPNQSAYINGHKVTQKSTKLRPGTYDVTVLTPNYESVHTKVKVSLFQTKEVAPKRVSRGLDDIAAAALGSNGFYGPPELSDARWFQNNSWLVGIVGPGSSTPAAFYYDHGTWNIKYFDASGYPSDVSKLPIDVATYLQKLTVSGQNQ